MDVLWDFFVSFVSGLAANYLCSLLQGLSSRPKRGKKGK